eukprot:Hpha_TRINITY_DN34946_c0_g1::TRINITY_DN34946_c0_g1_i1::g.184170::m.184170/K07466/RFA1, RPA1, rpa; replication factor A1
MAWRLDRGFCEAVLAGNDVAEGTCPTLQVLDAKVQKQDGGGKDRLRLLLSDGDRAVVSLLGSPRCESLLREQTMEAGGVVKLTDYVVTAAKNSKPVVVVIECEVLAPGLSLIGNPRHDFGPTMVSARVVQLPNTPVRSPGRKSMRSDVDSPAATPCPLGDLRVDEGHCTATVAGRVVRKSALRSWKNERGEGVLFWLELDDGSLPQRTRVTFFRDLAMQWSERIEEGKVYKFRHVTLKGPVQRPFQGVRDDLEIIADKYTRVEETDAPGEPPVVALERLGTLASRGEREEVDVVAMVARCSAVDEVTVRGTGEQRKRLVVTLSDDTGDLELTLWGSRAEGWDVGPGVPVLVRRGRIARYGGRTSLAVHAGTTLTFGEQAVALSGGDGNRLLQWWRSTCPAPGAGTGGAVPPSPAGEPRAADPSAAVVTVAELLDKSGEAGEWVVRATAVGLTGEPRYPSCDKCKKALKTGADGQGWCDSCGAVRVVCFRWLVRCTLTDRSGAAEVVFFDQAVAQLVGRAAAECSAEDAVAAAQQILNHERLFSVRSRRRMGRVSLDARPYSGPLS